MSVTASAPPTIGKRDAIVSQSNMSYVYLIKYEVQERIQNRKIISKLGAGNVLAF